MPEDKPESGQPYDPVKDVGSSPLPMGSEDILPDNPEWVASQKRQTDRKEFREWYANSIRSVFGNAASQIFQSIFGHTDAAAHVRVVTDYAPDAAAVGLVGTWENLQPDPFCGDPLVIYEDSLCKIRHGESAVPGSRIGVLVLYRARGQDILFPELEADTKKQLRQFEVDRIRGLDLGTVSTTVFDRLNLADGRFPESSPIDIVVVGSSELESQSFLTTPSQRPVGGVSDWGGIYRWLAEQFEEMGGDAAIAVSLVSETWQDRRVTPKHTPNTQPGITEPVGVPEPLAELASPKTPPLSDLMSIRSAAAELGCDQVILHRAIKAQKIAIFELGDGTKTVSLTECREFYKNRRTTPGPVPRDHK